jgi:hypothetical protein
MLPKMFCSLWPPHLLTPQPREARTCCWFHLGKLLGNVGMFNLHCLFFKKRGPHGYNETRLWSLKRLQCFLLLLLYYYYYYWRENSLCHIFKSLNILLKKKTVTALCFDFRITKYNNVCVAYTMNVELWEMLAAFFFSVYSRVTWAGNKSFTLSARSISLSVTCGTSLSFQFIL